MLRRSALLALLLAAIAGGKATGRTEVHPPAPSPQGSSGIAGRLQPGARVLVEGCGVFPRQLASVKTEADGQWIVELQNGRLKSVTEHCLSVPAAFKDRKTLKQENDKMKELLHLMDADYYTETNFALRDMLRRRLHSRAIEDLDGHLALPQALPQVTPCRLSLDGQLSGGCPAQAQALAAAHAAPRPVSHVDPLLTGLAYPRTTDPGTGLAYPEYASYSHAAHLR